MILILLIGPCGTGKSSLIDQLQVQGPSSYSYFDTDHVGLNYHDYVNKPGGGDAYCRDTLLRAIDLCQQGRLVFASCMSPRTFDSLGAFPKVQRVIKVHLACSSQDLADRLQSRPKWRQTHHEDFIASQQAYMADLHQEGLTFDWILDTSGLTLQESLLRMIDLLGRID